ncbi:MAG: cell division protein FtsQ/DivIB [Anaerolineae bacterium]|jgi:cell division septal protein FtsQ
MTRRYARRYRFESATPLVLGRRTTASAWRFRTRWLLVSLGAVAAAGLVLWFSFSPRFYILEARIVGEEWVSEDEIFTASGLQRLHVLWAREGKAEARILERFPSLQQVEVNCGFPADCTIRVVEHPPILTWQVGERVFWVNSAGRYLPAERPLEEGWVVIGPLPTSPEGRLEQQALVALKELEELNIVPRPIEYRPDRGLILVDEAGWRVILGQGEGMERRLRTYTLVKAHLLEHDIHPRYVDVRFPEAPYYSETNEW